MQNLAEKQDYLSKQILDQSYDPEEFQDYMLHHSNKELDLNLWTLAELKAVVAKFKKYKAKGVEGDVEEKEVEMEVAEGQKKGEGKGEAEEEREDMGKKMESSGLSHNSVNSSLYRHFEFKKKVNLPELYILVHLQKKPFSIKIKNYTKTIPNNIFKSSYIQYNIECSQGWRTKRRFTDFVWLQQYLKGMYEGLPIPPIPEKTTIRSFDQRHVEYRMMMFQKFLGTLAQMPETCSDPILEIFLRGSEEYFAQSKRKFQEKLDSNLGSTKLQSIFGSELVLMDQHSIEPHTLNFYKQYSAKLNNISSQLNVLIEDMKKIESDIFQISSSFQDLQTLLDSAVRGSSFTSVIQQFCTNMGMYMAKSSQFLKSNLYSTWNYETMYIQNLLSTLSKIQKQKVHMNEKYKNAMIKVPDQGSQAFTNSLEPNKLIKQFQMVKELYRIKLSHTVREMRRYEESQMVMLSRDWGAELRGFIRDISQWMIGCTDNLTKAMSVSQGKKLVEVQYIKK